MYVHVLESFMFLFACACLVCVVFVQCVMLLRHVACQSLFVCVPRLLCVCVCVWAKSSNTSMWCPILKVGTCQLANIAGIHCL